MGSSRAHCGLIALPTRTEKGPSRLEISDYVDAIVIGEMQKEGKEL